MSLTMNMSGTNIEKNSAYLREGLLNDRQKVRDKFAEAIGWERNIPPK